MLSQSTGVKEIIDKIGKFPLVLIVDLTQCSINVDLQPLRNIFHEFCKYFPTCEIFETIVKTHNEKTIDHAKLHTKQQK